MRILVAGGCDIPPPYGGLAGRVLNNITIWQREHDVHLLLPWAKPAADVPDEVRMTLHAVHPALPSKRSERLRFLLRRRLPAAIGVLLTRPALSMAVLRRARLLATARSGTHAGTALLDALAYAAAVDQLIERHRIDVIQAHYARHETFVCELVAARRSVPVVVETYSEAVCWPEDGIGSETAWSNDSIAMARWAPLFAEVFRRSAHVTATSVHCGQGALDFVPPEKLTVAYPGVDTASFRRARQLRAQFAQQLGLEGRKVILFVGQLAPRKGAQFLAGAATRLLAEETNATIVFVGSDIGGYRVLLESMISPEHADRVRFTGGISDKALRQYFAVCDVLAFPSASDRECFGMSMVEAMAAGAPVVAFRVGGTAEVVEDGVTGYLLPVGDVDALAEHLLAVLHGQLGADAAERCRERARSLFDIEVVARLEMEVLAAVTSKTRPRG
jgi:glycosyltransferase involved in cell wall biosynthesis